MTKRDPFKYFHSSPEIIRLAVMMYVRFPLSLRNVESAAMKIVDNAERQETGRWMNNRGENSHQPFRRRERAMLRFRQMKSLQKFSAVHFSIHNHFNQERALCSRENFKVNRAAALSEWRQLCST